MAERFAMPVYAVNLTAFNDRTLRNAVNDVPPNSVILLDDIDCMKTGSARPDPKDRGKKNGEPEDKGSLESLNVTLSGWLNVLDGFHAPENVLFMMTSNRIEAPDPALLRPGRIDYRLYLGEASRAQKVELYGLFFPVASEIEAELFVETHSKARTMAEFQACCCGWNRSKPHRV